MRVLQNRDEFDQEARPAGLATALDRAARLLDSCLDAQSPLFARLANLRDRLERSGIPEVEERLLQYLATEKTQSFEHAIVIKTADLLAQAAGVIELRLQALKIPLEELETKTLAFEDELRNIVEQRRVTGDLLTGDKRRLVKRLEIRIGELRKESRSHLADVVDTSLAGMNPSAWESTAQQTISGAIEKIFEAAREETARECPTDADAVLFAYQKRIDELVAVVRRTAGRLFEITFRKISNATVSRLARTRIG